MNYYDSTALGYFDLHYDEQIHKLRVIKENVNIPKKARVLDIGCGPCWSSDFFENVTGIDPSIELLKLSKNKNVRVGCVEKLPFANGSFDLILCISAIHHFDLDLALYEMKRVGAIGATFIITVLKKAKKRASIIKRIKSQFTVEKEIDEGNDLIFICH